MASVLILVDTLEVGGTERSILEICRRFKRIDVTVVHLFKGEALKPEFVASGINVISLNLSSPFSFFACYWAVKQLMKQHRPRVVMPHLFFTEFYCRLAAIGMPVQVVGTFVNDSYSSERYQRLPLSTRIKLRLYQLLDAITAKRCNVFLANSSTIAHSNTRALGIDAEKVSVIYRGRSVEKFSRVYEPHHNSLHFVNVGRLIERKGQEELIRAFSVIAARHPQARLSIAGEGYARGKLERLIQELKLQDRVVLLGNVKDVISLLYQADFFVFSSHYEGFSGALVEAMMVGIPIIASDIEMTREAIVHQYEGYLYDLKRPEALSMALEFGLNNRQVALSWGSLARTKAFKLFDIERIASDTEEYLELLKQS